MTTDEAIALVSADMAVRRTDWTLDECRKFVELGRKTISLNPDRFVDKYLDNINHHERARASA